MTKDIETFVGGKYIETIEYTFPELVNEIKRDIKDAQKNRELPNGWATINAYQSIAGKSIEVDYAMNNNTKKDFKKYKEILTDIVDQYNYVTRTESFMENDRRFYNEDIAIW